MAIDKTIRIQDLPISDFLNSDNLVIINDSDNITRSITFENLVDSITTLPEGINVPITQPGFPGISFCDELNPNCGTGIGSQGECQMFISVCGTNVIEIGPGNLVTINDDLQISGDLVVEDITFLKGDVNIGTGCAGPERFVVNSETTLNCKTDILGDTTIGTAPCASTLEVNAEAVFNCSTDFKADVDFGSNITIDGDILLGGNIVPPPGGQIDVILDDLTVNGEIILGNSQGDCSKNLKIYNKTFLFCDLISPGNDIEVGNDIKLDASTGVIKASKFEGDGSLITNLNIPGSLTFKGNIDVTDSNSPALADPQVGDLYINSVKGLPVAEFVGLNIDKDGNVINEEVELNQFVFYTAFDTWGKGSIQDQDGFVTLSTPQTVTGEKIFDGKITSPTPSGDESFEVVNVGYLESFVGETTDDLNKKFVTLDTIQNITGRKNFAEVVYAKTPTPLNDPNDPLNDVFGKSVVTVEYLTSSGSISPWIYDATTKILSPRVNTPDVKMEVVGSGKFGHIDISGLPGLPSG